MSEASYLYVNSWNVLLRSAYSWNQRWAELDGQMWTYLYSGSCSCGQWLWDQTVAAYLSAPPKSSRKIHQSSTTSCCCWGSISAHSFLGPLTYGSSYGILPNFIIISRHLLTFHIPQLTKEPFPGLLGRSRTTPSRYSHSSSFLMWWGLSRGLSKP
jgi:hypothetical protein